MPRYEANTPEGSRIKSVKLDGRELMGDPELGAIKTADTDEGWVDIYETETGPDGERHIKCTPWVTDSKTFKKTRELLPPKRLTGGVVVGE